MAGFGTFVAAFRALHAVEVVVFAAFGGTLFAGLDTDAEYLVREVTRIGERRCRMFAYLCAFYRPFDTAPHHVDSLLFEAGVETILACGLTFVDAI